MANQSTYEDGDVFSEDGYELVYPEYSIYTGSGFDASRNSGDGTGSTTNNHTIQIAAGEIKYYTKIYVTFYYNASKAGGTSGTADVHLTIATAENGGGFTSRFARSVAYATEDTRDRGSKTIVFLYVPTSGEKSNGLDVKFTGLVTTATNPAEGEITNIQTVVEYM